MHHLITLVQLKIFRLNKCSCHFCFKDSYYFFALIVAALAGCAMKTRQCWSTSNGLEGAKWVNGGAVAVAVVAVVNVAAVVVASLVEETPSEGIIFSSGQCYKIENLGD